ncbi:hypothetical protein [uncultured Eubacterium sp.]|nr:hypothetical protein [uncultured Eubacterium sp.]
MHELNRVTSSLPFEAGFISVSIGNSRVAKNIIANKITALFNLHAP